MTLGNIDVYGLKSQCSYDVKKHCSLGRKKDNVVMTFLVRRHCSLRRKKTM